MSINGLDSTIRWYDKNAKTYADNILGYSDLNHARTFLSKLQPNPLILDAGCGPGRDAHILSELGAKVIGIDLSKGLILEAKSVIGI
jgi:SAM-dependent methyltransferase